MNVLVSGPFGCGSLADETVLAGLLRHLAAGKHAVTVLSADPEGTNALHGVNALRLADPSALLSTPEAREPLNNAHLFVLAGAGVINDSGSRPARDWLAQLELFKRLNSDRATAVLGAGAQAIDDKRERVRAQRFLHHFADGISARDDATKQVLIGYGLSANRISSTGDPAFALFEPPPPPMRKRTRIGLILSTALPSRSCFGFEAAPASAALQSSVRELASQLLQQGAKLTLFSDDTEPARALADALAGENTEDQIQPAEPNESFAQLQARLADCQAVFSLPLHGLFLAAAARVPVIGVESETGAADFLARLGLAEYLVNTTGEAPDVPAALACIQRALAGSDAIRSSLEHRLAVLSRKEAQNRRMLERLVPKRDRYPPRKSSYSYSDD